MDAWNELNRIREFFKENEKSICPHVIAQGFEWQFIPPHALHFDELWESAIKSVKKYFLCMIEETRLMYEELCIVLA